jgi:hypothetical protein
MKFAGKQLSTLVILSLTLFAVVNTQAPVKRDFSLEEKIAGVPKICVQEILRLNLNGDCIKLVARSFTPR